MRIPAFAAAAAALLAFSVHAQEVTVTQAATVSVEADTTPRTSLKKGNWSISFGVPAFGSGGERGEFGAWEMVGSRTNLGLTLGVAVSGYEAESEGSDVTQAATAIDLGLNVKRYVMEPREVTPFLLGSIAAGGRFERREGAQFDETVRGTALTTRAAVGVEWFPVRRISLSGQTGFSLYASRSTARADLPDDTTRNAESRALSFSTFTSALSLQIWF